MRLHGKYLRPGWWSKHLEPVLLAAVLFIAGMLWAFVEIADEVLEKEWKVYDKAILMAMRNPDDLTDAWGPGWLEEAVRDVTTFGSFTFIILSVATVIVFLLLNRQRFAALYVFCAVGGGILMIRVLKMIFSRPRPDLVPHLSHVQTASFPSGHTTLSAVVFLTMGAVLAKSQERRSVKIFVLSLAVFLSLAVGLSRVYLGVHWPTDVLAGWCVGSAWAILAWVIAHWLEHHGPLRGNIKKSV